MSSFFGSAPSGPTPLTMAKIEAEILTEMFNKMTIVCAKKCVVRYHDGELAVGEMACIDRCAGKYLHAQEKVGEVLNSFEQQMKMQEKSNVPKFGSS